MSINMLRIRAKSEVTFLGVKGCWNFQLKRWKFLLGLSEKDRLAIESIRLLMQSGLVMHNRIRLGLEMGVDASGKTPILIQGNNARKAAMNIITYLPQFMTLGTFHKANADETSAELKGLNAISHPQAFVEAMRHQHLFYNKFWTGPQDRVLKDFLPRTFEKLIPGWVFDPNAKMP